MSATVIRIDGDASGFEKATLKAVQALTGFRDQFQYANKEAEKSTKELLKTFELASLPFKQVNPEKFSLGASLKQAASASGEFKASLVSSNKEVDKSTKELLKTFQMTSIPFKTLGPQAKFTMKEVSAAGLETKGVYTEIGSSFKNTFGELVKGAAVGSLVAQGLSSAISGIKSFYNSSIEEARNAEEEQTKLSQALRVTGSESDGTKSAINDFANEIQRTTKFTGGAIVEQIALAKTLGATTTQSMGVAKAATELSATFGGDLEQNTRLLSQTLQGEVGKLGKLVPEVNALTKEQLQAGAAIDLVNKKLAGAASGEIENNRGKTAQLTNAYASLKEKLGGAIITMTTFETATVGLTNWLGRMAQSLEDVRIENERGKEGFKENSDSLNQLSREYEDLTERIEALQKKKQQMGSLDNVETAMLKKYTSEIQILGEVINKTSDDIAKSGGFDILEGTGGSTEANEEMRQRVNERKEMILELQQAQIDSAAYTAEQDILERTRQAEMNESDMEQMITIEQMKIESRYALEEQKLAMITDVGNRQLAAEALQVQKSLAIQKSGDDIRKKNTEMAAKNEIAFDQKTTDMKLGIARQASQLVTAIAKEGSREAFVIQKAVAAAEIMVADGKARALVPAQTATIPYPANLAAAAQMMGYISISTGLGLATVAAQTLKGFNKGGVFEDGNMFGDSGIAALTKGEIIAPRQSFDEVVEGVAKQRGYVKADENQAQGQGMVFNFHGDILADDQFVNNFIEKIRNAVQFYNADLGVK